MSKKPIPVGISARHVHVSQADLATLFGEGYELHPYKDLSQPGQYASQETVDLVTEKSTFKKVRILGPVRKQTQVEVALTDAMKLGVNPPVRDSGDLKGSAGLKIVGPKGSVELAEGVIAACRHIHMTPQDAAEFGVKDKEMVKVKVGAPDRCLVFEQVLVRVNDNFRLEMHLDTDEGNAAKVKTGETAELLK
jgi:putative phosphotransacetylase